MEREPTSTLFRFATISPVGELEFEGTAATDKLQADGYALSMAGGDISRFRDGKAPLLLQHDPTKIIGTSSLRKTSRALILRGKFCSPGVSATADEARRLLKDNALNSLSLGFVIEETEPLGKSRKDGLRAVRWTALECSLVAIGMDPEAQVTARALSRLLGRSGRRISAETERCLRTALAHHKSGMRSHRDAASMIESLVDRDDDMMGDDEGERSRLRRQVELRRRRWSPVDQEWFARLAAVEKRRNRPERQRALERLRALGARY